MGKPRGSAASRNNSSSLNERSKPHSKTSPKRSSSYQASVVDRRRRDIHHNGNTIRYKQRETNSHGCCSNRESRKGVGAVLFTLGIPSFIAGLIITIVSATDDGSKDKYPDSFIVGGPTLLVISVILFCVGLFLHSSYARKVFQDCFSLNQPDSFCRVKCPRLSHLLSPDESIIINQSGMRALQTEPTKSALKKKQFLLNNSPAGGEHIIDQPKNNANTNTEINDNILQNDGDVFDNTTTATTNNISFDRSNQGWTSRTRRNSSRGVRFSDSGGGEDDETQRKRTSSVVSDNGSLLSLKHCKIHPKNDIWWTDETTTKPQAFHTVDENAGDSIQTTDL